MHPPTMTSLPLLSAMTLGPGKISKRTHLGRSLSFHAHHPRRYFRKFEKYTPDPRFPHVDASLRGSRGPVTVGYHANIWEGSPLFVDASINAGIPFNPDFTTANGTLGTNKVRLPPVQC